MKKNLIIVAGLLALNVNAVEINFDSCAGVAYVNNQSQQLVPYDPGLHTSVDKQTPVTYIGKQLIPHLRVGSSRGFNVIVTNTSAYDVTFSYHSIYFSEVSGNTATYSGENYSAVFSNNSPSSANGALMPPDTMGRVTGWSTGSTVYSGYASIQWQASQCLDEPPMLTFVENYYSPNSKALATTFNVNQGEKW